MPSKSGDDDKSVDELVRDYIRHQMESERRGYSLKALSDAVTTVATAQAAMRREVADTMASHEGKDNDRHGQLLSIIKGHDARLDALEKAADDSGAHIRAKLDTFDSDLELTEHSLAAANKRISDITKLLSAAKQEKEAAEKAQLAAENSQLRADAAAVESEKKAEAASKKAFRGKILAGVVVFATTGVLGWVAHVLLTASGH